MKQRMIDMTEGKPSKILLLVAFPIIASNFIQTAFGLINMVWVGRLGSEAVSSIGTASFYINLATAMTTLVVIGSGIKIAQSIGASQMGRAHSYVKNSIILACILALIFCIVVGISAPQLIHFFEMDNDGIVWQAIAYLRASLIGVPFLFLATTLTAILTSFGNTKLAFQANAAGFILNMLLDPLLIFGVGIVPSLGVVGAAHATTIARLLTCVLLIAGSRSYIYESIKSQVSIRRMADICQISLPVTIQRVVFIFISIYMAKIIVRFGTDAIAVQKIGVQIESISYMTIGGVQGAIAAFIGQNYGAKKFGRIQSGFTDAIRLVSIFGLLTSCLFIFFPQPIFRIFIKDSSVIEAGVGYMRTIGYSQIFMCLELLSVGAFNGMGKTYIPPIVSIIFTALRIPLAIMLSGMFGLEGVWMSISITSITKGIILTSWFKIDINKSLKEKKELV